MQTNQSEVMSDASRVDYADYIDTLTPDQSMRLIRKLGVPPKFASRVDANGNRLFSLSDLFAVVNMFDEEYTVKRSGKRYSVGFDCCGYSEKGTSLLQLMYILVVKACESYGLFRERQRQNEAWDNLTDDERTNVALVCRDYADDGNLTRILADRFGKHNISEIALKPKPWE